MSEESHKKIFISHSSKDKQIVDIFVDKLLHLGLQIDPNDVAYTSREETGVGTGEDIRKFIKENISTCDFVFFMISENYKKSEICLNEMGAAWATDRTVIPLVFGHHAWSLSFPLIKVFPNLSFDSIGWLYNVRKGLLLNDPDALDSIFDDITEKYSYKPRINTWNRNKNEFILFINNLNSQSTSPILISDITVNNSDIIEVNAEEVEDLDIFDIRENFDSKCREFNELMNNLSIQQNEFNDRMPKHVEQLNAVGATKNMKKIRIAIMAVANDMDDIATLYDESAPKIITIFGEIIDWGVKLQQYDLGDNNEQIKAENREALHSLVIAVLTGKNALINGRNELTKIIGIEKHQKRAQRRLTESYTKIIEAFEKCTIKANDMANA